MFEWLKSMFKPPKPAGPPQRIRAFGPSDRPIIQDGVAAEGNGWRIESREKRTVRLFEVPNPGAEQCMLTYRARMKAANLQGGAYLEMWCRLAGQGEFFSKGLHQKVAGTTDWGSYEVPFYLKKGQRPDLIKLNLTVEGAGTVWMKDLELLKTPLV
jgi:hypothetical protein